MSPRGKVIVPFLYRACRLATSSQKTHCDGFLYSSGAGMKDEDPVQGLLQRSTFSG